MNQNTDVVKKFDELIGRTYDIQTKDLSQIDFRAPQQTNEKGEVTSTGSTSTGVVFEDLDGNQISTEDAEKAGYKARVIVPIAEGKKRQVPYPEWKNILEKYNQLPRVGDAPGGVSVQGGKPNAAVTTPNKPPVMTPAEAAKLPSGTPFTGTDGQIYIAP